MSEFDFESSKCLGPFIIFKDEHDHFRYILSNRKRNEIFFDGETPTMETTIDVDTHDELQSIIEDIFGTLLLYTDG